MLSQVSNGLAGLATRALSCSTLLKPSIKGAEVVSFTAEAFTRYAAPPIFAPYFQIASGQTTFNVSYCQVAIAYTHIGQNDTVNLQIWLPEIWNGRFQGTGGSGWRAGIFDLALVPAIIGGYAAASTDGGHTLLDTGASPWALKSDDNVDLVAFQDFSYVTLEELSVLGKQVTESFYGRKPDYAYWNGCSQGGRQGMMLAQRYPDAFDGIVAGAPAINWTPLMGLLYTPQATLHTLNSTIGNCELEGITTSAIAHCDGLDGVLDGIVSLPDLCQFDAFSQVGNTVTCRDGSSVTISMAAATVANATWTGVRTPLGRPHYPGLTYDAPLTSAGDTSCYASGNCSDTAWALGAQYFQYLVAKDSALQLSTITSENLPNYVSDGIHEWDSWIGTVDPDLSEFKKMGGKLLSWHGMADDYIPVGGTTQYYDQVRLLDAEVGEYYKLFLAPGVHHCGAGPGASPVGTVFDTLVRWVENGTTPHTLPAIGTEKVNGTILKKNLCPYPTRLTYQGGDVSMADSYRCVEHDRLRHD